MMVLKRMVVEKMVLKKALMVGVVVVVTLIAIEVVAHLAYAITYGELYRPDALAGIAPTQEAPTQEKWQPPYGKHPYVGSAVVSSVDERNTYPPHRGGEDTIVIGVFGGTLVASAIPRLAKAVTRYLHGAGFKKVPVVLNLSFDIGHQPQQLMMAINRLVLGGRFDIIVNLDGPNDAWWPLDGQYHGFPIFHPQSTSAATHKPLGVVAALRERQKDLAQLAEAGLLRHSAVFGLTLRNRLDAVERQVVESNEALAAAQARYDLERNGPHERGHERTQQEIRAPRSWYRASAMLAGIAHSAGADYYHFLEPNFHGLVSSPPSDEGEEGRSRPCRLVGSPLSDEGEAHPYASMYPALAAWGGQLRRAGVAFFDLMQAFASHRAERLFREDCYPTRDGLDFLSDQIVSRIAPSLDALRRDDRAVPRPPLDPGDPASERLLVDGYDYDLLLRQGKRLVYRRTSCPKAYRGRFILHVWPLRDGRLESVAGEHEFENHDFPFRGRLGARVGDRCVVEYRLPDYPIWKIRTGEYVTGGWEPLWTMTVDFLALGPSLPFKVFRGPAGTIVYKRLDCTAADMEKPFFLHVLPAAGVLPASSAPDGDAWPTMPDGYVKLDFSHPRGDLGRVLPDGGACVFEREVPFAYSRLRTGQYDAVSLDPYWQRDIGNA